MKTELFLNFRSDIKTSLATTGIVALAYTMILSITGSAAMMADHTFWFQNLKYQNTHLKLPFTVFRMWDIFCIPFLTWGLILVDTWMNGLRYKEDNSFFFQVDRGSRFGEMWGLLPRPIWFWKPVDGRG